MPRLACRKISLIQSGVWPRDVEVVLALVTLLGVWTKEVEDEEFAEAGGGWGGGKWCPLLLDWWREMALKFKCLADETAVAVAGVVADGEFFGDDVAKNRGLAPLKSDFDRTWTDPPKMLLSCVAAGDWCGVVVLLLDLVVLVDNKDDTLGL